VIGSEETIAIEFEAASCGPSPPNIPEDERPFLVAG